MGTSGNVRERTADEVTDPGVLQRRRHLHQLHLEHLVYGGQHVLHLGLQLVHALLSCAGTFEGTFEGT